MSFRKKFSFLLVFCVLVSVYFTTHIQSTFFSSDQEAYLNELQTHFSLFSSKQLEDKLETLYSQLENLSNEHLVEKWLKLNSGFVGFEIWRNNKVVLSSYIKSVQKPPPPGNTKWAIVESPQCGKTECFRWVGRYTERTVLLDIEKSWIVEALYASHGARAELILPDGMTLASSFSEAISGREYFENLDILKKEIDKNSNLPQTVYYRSTDRSERVGTFSVLQADPPLVLVISSSRDIVKNVLYRIYKRSLWIAFFFLIVAIGIGTVFSHHLAFPLQLLAEQTEKVSQGHFDGAIDISESRKDEIGKLAQSFNHMLKELLHIKNELRKNERMATFGKFSASIAHEIKNPLSGILSNAQLVSRKLLKVENLNKEKISEALSYVEEEVLRANQIISQLMKFARHDAPPKNPLHLSETVRHSLVLLKNLLEEQRIDCKEKIEDNLWVYGDSHLLHEVILNLVQNAIHAMQESITKQMSVTLTRIGNDVVLEIGDSGHGMTDEVKEHLFEPFFTTKEIGKGTGLGLSVCHGILQTHRAIVKVMSEVGKGTQFSIHFSRTLEVNVQSKVA